MAGRPARSGGCRKLLAVIVRASEASQIATVTDPDTRYEETRICRLRMRCLSFRGNQKSGNYAEANPRNDPVCRNHRFLQCSLVLFSAIRSTHALWIYS
jgi:hypothetical protein